MYMYTCTMAVESCHSKAKQYALLFSRKGVSGLGMRQEYPQTLNSLTAELPFLKMVVEGMASGL